MSSKEQKAKAKAWRELIDSKTKISPKEFTDRAAKEVSDQKSNNTIFAVVSSTSPELRNVKFFSTKEKAMIFLKTIAQERRHKMGVDVIEDTTEKFSYLFGWEEHQVTFSIVELPIE